METDRHQGTVGINRRLLTEAAGKHDASAAPSDSGDNPHQVPIGLAAQESR